MHPYQQAFRKFRLLSLYQKLSDTEFGNRTPSKSTINSFADNLSENGDLSLDERILVCRVSMLKCMHQKFHKCLNLQNGDSERNDVRETRSLLRLNFEIYRLGRFILKYDRQNFHKLKAKLQKLNQLIKIMSQYDSCQCHSTCHHAAMDYYQL
jgi:hypothetical protein